MNEQETREFIKQARRTTMSEDNNKRLVRQGSRIPSIAPDLAELSGDLPDISEQLKNFGTDSTSGVHVGTVFPRGMWEPPRPDLESLLKSLDRFDAIVQKVVEINAGRWLFPEDASVVVRMVLQAMAEVSNGRQNKDQR